MILDGKNTAALRKERLATYVREEREAGREKKLAVLLVGDSAPSEMYAQSVRRVAESVGDGSCAVPLCRRYASG